MSDFLYLSDPKNSRKLAAHIRAIYRRDTPLTWEYHGPWGSLAVSQGHYMGFSPVETSSHLCAIIGGPVLCFRDNSFLTGNDPLAGTRSILERWQSGQMNWADDVSGPFVALLIDKENFEIQCVTDLMMFIPVYQHIGEAGLTLGTHVDAVAEACGKSHEFDEVSLADFILHDAVTYPHTAYQEVYQAYPAAIRRYQVDKHGCVSPFNTELYWQPNEEYEYFCLDDAARMLRTGVQAHVNLVTEGMDHVAQFISAGEDSRAVAGMLPTRLKRDAYIFLDTMNWEGKIAEKASQAYNLNFHRASRSATHYLEILSEANALVGLGHAYYHAHSLGFHKSCALRKYPAVFGGYLSDSLLKGIYSRKVPWCDYVSLFPKIEMKGESRSRDVRNPLFTETCLDRITERRREHLTLVSSFRKVSAHEWFTLWPMTMRTTISYNYSNRRLFASCEPFTANHIIKLSATVPTRWKLNSRLFRAAMHPMLKKSRWLPSAKGGLPYFPWWASAGLQIWVCCQIQAAKHFSLIKQNQGPWADWNAIIKSKSFHTLVERARKPARQTAVTDDLVNGKNALLSTSLSVQQRLNILQIVDTLARIDQ